MPALKGTIEARRHHPDVLPIRCVVPSRDAAVDHADGHYQTCAVNMMRQLVECLGATIVSIDDKLNEGQHRYSSNFAVTLCLAS